jgi:hypothetical protein
MQLPAPTASWSQEIGAAAETEMKAVAKFYDPELRTGQPDGDDYIQPDMVIDSKARVQQIRQPRDSSTPDQWSTSRWIRIQIPLKATSGMIRKGIIVQVEQGDDPDFDPTLALISFTVQSAVNSSSAALRTVECVSTISAVPRIP